MELKIITIEIAHKNEYVLPDVKEIIAVDFYETKHERNAALICRME